MTLHTQFLAMGAMLAGGMYIGFVNETFRRFVPSWKWSSFLTYSFEILFWLMQTALLYYVLFKINYGEIRFYLFTALIAGFLLYLLLFQAIYVKVLNFVIRVVKKIVLTLYKMMMLPIIYILQLLMKMLKFVLRIVTKIIHVIFTYFVVPLIKLLVPKKVYNFISKKGALCSTMVSTLYSKLLTFFKKMRR